MIVMGIDRDPPGSNLAENFLFGQGILEPASSNNQSHGGLVEISCLSTPVPTESISLSSFFFSIIPSKKPRGLQKPNGSSNSIFVISTLLYDVVHVQLYHI